MSYLRQAHRIMYEEGIPTDDRQWKEALEMAYKVLADIEQADMWLREVQR